MGRSRTRLVTMLPSQVAVSTVIVEILWFQFIMSSCKTTRTKCRVTLWLEFAQDQSLCCKVGWPQALWQWRYYSFSLLHDLVVTASAVPARFVSFAKAELTASVRHIERFLKRFLNFLQFQSRGHGWLKNEEKNKSKGNSKAFCILRKGEKAQLKFICSK